ncbi:MAG: cation-efflux pump [Chloroflexaceae bacterium]|nr:cation-efflux pump [Chloroflexaceae bacterium]
MPLSKKSAALLSVGLTVLLASVKLLIGFVSGSLSILAEAADAVIDLVTDGVTFLAVRVSDLPPDEDHPYGHARAENLGALAQAVLMVMTYGWVLVQVGKTLLLAPQRPAFSLWFFLVMSLSLGINLVRVQVLRQAASRFKSQALKASATNFLNDILRSLVVLLTMGVIMLAPRLSLPSWFVERCDAIAAALVALVALRGAWILGKQAIHTLMDGIPYDLSHRLTSRIAALPSVVPNSASVRARFVGEQPFVEVMVGMPRGHSLEEAHELAHKVEDAIRLDLHEASVLVHVEPTRTVTEPYTTAVYSAAQRLGLRVHNLAIYQLKEEIRIEMDLELPGSMTLTEAHPFSERLEAAIAAELSCPTVIAVHLEPRHDQVQPAVRYAPLEAQVCQAITALPNAASIGLTEALLTNDGVVITLRCYFPGDTRLTDVHTAMARTERDLRRVIPDVVRVQIDPEPDDRRPAADTGDTGDAGAVTSPPR